jgi:hypothetical protein
MPLIQTITTSTGGSGLYVPLNRTITINGVTYDLSADRTWNISNAAYTEKVKHLVKLGTNINKGQAVYVSSATGTNMIVSKASNTSEATSSKTLGLLETGGVTNDQVYVITEGLIDGIDTSTATIGDPVWLGTNGDLIFGLVNKPYAPAHLVYIGVVTRVQSQNGEIFVHIQNGFELKEIHDVSALTPSNNQALKYNSSTGLWQNGDVVTSVDITTSTSGVSISGGPITTTGSFTLNIGSASSSTNGLLTSTDWSAFMGKMNNPFTSLGDMVYSNAAGAALRLAGNTAATLKFLSQTGDGFGNSAAPIWLEITATSIGAVPTTRSITINGTAFDLSANRTWSVGTVTSIGLSSSTSGITIGSTPITSSGTITIDIATASSSTNGLLSSTDWSAFDAKLNSPLIGLGDMIYSNASGAALRLAPNISTTRKVLSMIGSGTTGGAPQWRDLQEFFTIDYDTGVTGSRNSINTIFTTTANFITGSTRVFRNGLRMTNGAGYDYTETSTNQITFANPPDSGDLLIVEYIKL